MSSRGKKKKQVKKYTYSPISMTHICEPPMYQQYRKDSMGRVEHQLGKTPDELSEKWERNVGHG